MSGLQYDKGVPTHEADEGWEVGFCCDGHFDG